MGNGSDFSVKDTTSFLVISGIGSDLEACLGQIKLIATECLNSLAGGSVSGVLIYVEGRTQIVSIDNLTVDDISKAINDEQVTICLSDLDAYDWERTLALVSGDAATDFMVVGIHPDYESPVSQSYDNGDLGTGIIESHDEDEHMTSEIKDFYDAIARGPAA